jgi:hypothetical protein
MRSSCRWGGGAVTLAKRSGEKEAPAWHLGEIFTAVTFLACSLYTSAASGLLMLRMTTVRPHAYASLLPSGWREMCVGCPRVVKGAGA